MRGELITSMAGEEARTIVREMEVFRLPHPWKTRIYVVLRTEDGLEGVGEATVGQVSCAVVGALRDIEPYVRGSDLREANVIVHRLCRDVYADGGQILAAAVAGVEMASWDLLGKATGVPLYRLLGGRCRSEHRLYANGWYRGRREPDEIADLARKTVKAGFTALKIDPFGAAWRTLTQGETERSLTILEAVRGAVGSEVGLIVEAHSRFDAATACRIARRMEELGPLWFEEPVPYTDLAGYRRVAESTTIPVAGGESLWNVGQFVDLLAAAPIGVVQFDPIHVRGIAASRTVAELALARNALVAPHSASGPVNSLVCAHLATAFPHVPLLEWFIESDEEEAEPMVSSIAVGAGVARVSDEPGIGVRFDVEELRALHSEAEARDQNLFEPGWEWRRGAGR